MRSPGERRANGVETPWVLLSKPVRAPLRDGTSVLVRNLVRALPEDRRVFYFGDPRVPVRPAGDEVISAPAFGYQPGLRDKAGILMRLMSPRLARSPIHSFFAPNRLSAAVLEGLRRVPPRPVMQTLPASTGARSIAGLLRRLDRVVVTSDWGRQQLLEAGLHEDRVVRIYPGIEHPTIVPEEPLAERQTVLFAGDLDAQVAERLIRLAQRLGNVGWQLIIASRPKGPEHAAAAARLDQALAAARRAGLVTMLGEVADIRQVFDRASMQVYLASHARRKVDIPLVLLEGLARGVPAAVIDALPVDELARVGRAAGHEAVLSLDGEDFESGLDALLEVLADPARLMALGRHTSALVQQCFGAPAMAGAYLRLYEALE